VKALGLLYHDVVDRGDFAASGFPGADADRYKLEVGEFRDHLHAIDRAGVKKPRTSLDLLRGAAADEPLLMLTFDDGGVSAYTHAAALLEERDWRGHFFVTTSRIGSRSFLTPVQIRSLHQRGHVIGSHSHAHPARMSACPWKELLQEWHTSRCALSDLLGESVTVASIPGGYFSRRVAEAASLAGFRVLFTSEPITRCRWIDDCLVVGRYCLQRGDSASTAAQIARGHWPPRVRSWLAWNVKKVAKKVGGELYIKARLALLR
jgi:peptidoglycan/xylan/chitin deacetylase (PgdA/CDA1 family)